jgi:hypothetical protein
MNKTCFFQRLGCVLFVSVAVFLACSQRVTMEEEAPEDSAATPSSSKASEQLSIPNDPTRVPEMDAWVIHVDTDGGFTGGGRGRMTVTSQGRVVASRPGMINREYSICRAQLSITYLENINQAVMSAQPDAWRPSYTPPHDLGCCDRFGWRIKLQLGESGNTERAYPTSWYDGNPLPIDLISVVRAAKSIMDDVLKGCEN